MSRIVAPQWVNRRRRGEGRSSTEARRLQRDWSGPLQYPTDLVCFYDARRLGLADGASVATWPDRSSNGHDLTQGTSSKQPIYRGVGSASAINGVPAVEFDGSDDMLTSTEFGSEWSGDENALTYVAVLELPGTSGDFDYMWGPGNGSDDAPMLHTRDQGGEWGFQYRADDGSNANIGTDAPTEGGPDVVSWRFVQDADGTDAFLQARTHRLIEASNDLNNPLVGTITFDQFGLGGIFRTSEDNHAAFTIGMLACWSRRLDFEELLVVERWMGDAYGLTVA